VTQTTVLLIRHGLTDWNQEKRWQGHYNAPLNAVGREQARRLARRLEGWPIRALYSSDLARAADTARILGKQIGVEPVFDPAWRELHAGLFERHTRDEIRERFPEAWAQMAKGFVEAPQGETTADLARRVVPRFEQLLAERQGEMFAIVSHGATLRSLLSHILGLSAEVLPHVTLDGNTGLSVIEVHPGRPAVISRLNDIAHLEVEGGAWG
jgi:broad specificity phosphatase PhoE